MFIHQHLLVCQTLCFKLLPEDVVICILLMDEVDIFENKFIQVNDINDNTGQYKNPSLQEWDSETNENPF